jgi:hypothetical protein
VDNAKAKESLPMLVGVMLDEFNEDTPPQLTTTSMSKIEYLSGFFIFDKTFQCFLDFISL